MYGSWMAITKTSGTGMHKTHLCKINSFEGQFSQTLPPVNIGLRGTSDTTTSKL